MEWLSLGGACHRYSLVDGISQYQRIEGSNA
jgi:hypothetical protein